MHFAAMSGFHNIIGMIDCTYIKMKFVIVQTCMRCREGTCLQISHKALLYCDCLSLLSTPGFEGMSNIGPYALDRLESDTCGVS